jgi:hypothetical protein
VKLGPWEHKRVSDVLYIVGRQIDELNCVVFRVYYYHLPIGQHLKLKNSLIDLVLPESGSIHLHMPQESLFDAFFI